jgi:hypothetical protein
MQFKRLTAPSHWAPAIVNCDYSGLDAEDIGHLNTFLARKGVSFTDCHGCEEGPFIWHHDAAPETGVGAQCHVYFFPIKGGAQS